MSLLGESGETATARAACFLQCASMVKIAHAARLPSA
jgi:hypothetical protein